MAIVLALDVGDKWIGTALTDEIGRFALPHKTFKRAQGNGERAIVELIKTKQIQLVIVGLPLDEQGNKTQQCFKIEQFARRIARRSGVNIEFVDEYGTSEEAMDLLRSQGKNARRAKEIVDTASAVLILNSYLAHKNGEKSSA